MVRAAFPPLLLWQLRGIGELAGIGYWLACSGSCINDSVFVFATFQLQFEPEFGVVLPPLDVEALVENLGAVALANFGRAGGVFFVGISVCADNDQ